MLQRDFFIVWPWPSAPLLSILLWIGVAVVLLYLARFPSHRALISLSRLIHSTLRLAARSVCLVERRVTQRTREVLLEAGAKEIERSIEREFQRIAEAVTRDLSGYPALQRTLAEQSDRVDEEYRSSALLPSPPPGWVRAVEALAKLPAESDPSLAVVLTVIHKMALSQHDTAMAEYHKAVAERQALLKGMLPYWRKVAESLGELGGMIKRLEDHAKIIDARMTEYEDIRRGSDQAERGLAASSMARFFAGAAFLVVALAGAVLNFYLIALPMSEMVGGGSYIGSFKSSSVAALVIILVEFAMGLYLMESLGITRLFPSVGQIDDKTRKRLSWVVLVILIVLAGVEASLGYVRDQLAGNLQALQQSLAGVQEGPSVSRWIPAAGQMVIAFVLPFALTFGAIPLEAFIRSGRIVLGVVAASLMRWIAFGLRASGNLVLRLGKLGVQVYDLLIFPPLWVESLVRYRGRRGEELVEEQAPQ
jgi:hypothetical protein